MLMTRIHRLTCVITIVYNYCSHSADEETEVQED